MKSFFEAEVDAFVVLVKRPEWARVELVGVAVRQLETCSLQMSILQGWRGEQHRSSGGSACSPYQSQIASEGGNNDGAGSNSKFC